MESPGELRETPRDPRDSQCLDAIELGLGWDPMGARRDQGLAKPMLRPRLLHPLLICFRDFYFVWGEYVPWDPLGSPGQFPPFAREK